MFGASRRCCVYGSELQGASFRRKAREPSVVKETMSAIASKDEDAVNTVEPVDDALGAVH